MHFLGLNLRIYLRVKKLIKIFLAFSFFIILPRIGLTNLSMKRPCEKYVKAKVCRVYPVRNLKGTGDNVKRREESNKDVISNGVYNAFDKGKPLIQLLKVEILGPDFRYLKLNIENYIWDNEGYNTYVNTGDTIVLKVVESKGRLMETQVMGYYRSPCLYLAGLIFFLLFLAIAGVKKIGAVLTIVLNIAIVLVLIPILKRGYPPVLATLILGGAGIAITVAIIFGGGKKFTASLAGALAGLTTAGILTSVFIDLMHLSGMFSWDSRMLLVASRHLENWNIWDFKGLISAGVMITCLGAVVDIAVSIVSSCFEISMSVKKISAQSLYSSGMKVGRDIIATMINSLMLVFLGVSLPLIAVFEILGIPFIRVINFDFFSVLILSALVVNISLVVTVPSAAFISGRLFKK